jgi:hypothetical protein
MIILLHHSHFCTNLKRFPFDCSTLRCSSVCTQVTPEIRRELRGSTNRGDKATYMSIYILNSPHLPIPVYCFACYCLVEQNIYSCYQTFVLLYNTVVSLTLSLRSPVSVITKPIEEDRWDVPEVPMEED